MQRKTDEILGNSELEEQKIRQPKNTHEHYKQNVTVRWKGTTAIKRIERTYFELQTGRQIIVCAESTQDCDDYVLQGDDL